jgi:hypothetical protein
VTGGLSIGWGSRAHLREIPKTFFSRPYEPHPRHCEQRVENWRPHRRTDLPAPHLGRVQMVTYPYESVSQIARTAWGRSHVYDDEPRLLGLPLKIDRYRRVSGEEYTLPFDYDPEKDDPRACEAAN